MHKLTLVGICLSDHAKKILSRLHFAILELVNEKAERPVLG
jgi:hypothetical protein